MQHFCFFSAPSNFNLARLRVDLVKNLCVLNLSLTVEEGFFVNAEAADHNGFDLLTEVVLLEDKLAVCLVVLALQGSSALVDHVSDGGRSEYVLADQLEEHAKILRA